MYNYFVPTKKKSASSAPPCLKVKIGASKGTHQRTEGGCATVGTGSFDRKSFNLGKKFGATSKTVDAIDGKYCGTDKHGKKKKCPEPCQAVSKRKTCPVQLVFDRGQPFLRFCRAAKEAGYRVNVESSREAVSVAERACAHWKRVGSFEGYFPSGTPLRGRTK